MNAINPRSRRAARRNKAEIIDCGQLSHAGFGQPWHLRQRGRALRRAHRGRNASIGDMHDRHTRMRFGFGAISRPIASVPAPGANGTTMRTARSGQALATGAATQKTPLRRLAIMLKRCRGRQMRWQQIGDRPRSL